MHLGRKFFMAIIAMCLEVACYFGGALMNADISFAALMTALAGTAGAFITFNAIQKKYVSPPSSKPALGFQPEAQDGD